LINFFHTLLYIQNQNRPKGDTMRDLCDEVSRDLFEKFIETGEAPEDLLNHIDQCEKCGAEAERVFHKQARAFEGLAKALREEREKRKE